MNKDIKESLNDFMVYVFNQILAWEGQTVKKTGVKNLTIRELHTIEAVVNLTESGTNTMANIAKFLCITPGALTTNINSLVKKGYVERMYTPKDRRVIYIVPTTLGRRVNEIHEKFHARMINHIIDILDDEELPVLVKTLKNLGEYFNTKIEQ